MNPDNVFLTCRDCGWALDDEDYDICLDCESDDRDWMPL